MDSEQNQPFMIGFSLFALYYLGNFTSESILKSTYIVTLGKSIYTATIIHLRGAKNVWLEGLW